MISVNFLYYFIKRLLKKEDLKYEDLPKNRYQWLEERNKKPSFLNTVLYAVNNPVASLDRVLALIYDYVQIKRNKYGVVTYIAVKE